MIRQYSSTSVETTLASGISSSATSMTVATGTATALLGGVTLAAGNVDQFTVAIDPDTTNEEIVFITGVASDTFTIQRGKAGSSAIAHSAGAIVQHVLSSDDLNAFKASINPVTNVQFSGSSSGTTTVQASAVAGTTTITLPAVTDTVVTLAASQTLTNKDLTSATNSFPSSIVTTTGTQTLTNKTIDYNSNTITNLPVVNLDITLNAQTGTTYTLAATDKNKLVTLDNASAITLTVPANATIAFATGSQVNIQQIGAGQVTISGAAGVTVNGLGTKLSGQWAAATLIKTDTNVWTLIGALTS